MTMMTPINSMKFTEFLASLLFNKKRVISEDLGQFLNKYKLNLFNISGKNGTTGTEQCLPCHKQVSSASITESLGAWRSSGCNDRFCL